jgi:hypothetical protein
MERAVRHKLKDKKSRAIGTNYAEQCTDVGVVELNHDCTFLKKLDLAGS